MPTWNSHPLNQWTEGYNAALKFVKGLGNTRGLAEKKCPKRLVEVVHHKCLKAVKNVNSTGYIALRDKWESLACIVLSWVTFLIPSLIKVTELEKAFASLGLQCIPQGGDMNRRVNIFQNSWVHNCSHTLLSSSPTLFSLVVLELLIIWSCLHVTKILLSLNLKLSL